MNTGKTLMVVGVCVFGVLINQAFSSKMSNKQLIQMATEQQTPFSEMSLKRLYGDLFGQVRTTPSSDVILLNKMDKTFRLRGKSCEAGDFSKDLQPEPILAPKSASVFGMDSTSHAAGIVCTLAYDEVTRDQKVATGEYVKMDVENKQKGPNGLRYLVNGTYDVVSGLGQYSNNQIYFLIQP